MPTQPYHFVAFFPPPKPTREMQRALVMSGAGKGSSAQQAGRSSGNDAAGAARVQQYQTVRWPKGIARLTELLVISNFTLVALGL